jgi:hypothetical protein
MYLLKTSNLVILILALIININEINGQIDLSRGITFHINKHSINSNQDNLYLF